MSARSHSGSADPLQALFANANPARMEEVLLVEEAATLAGVARARGARVREASAAEAVMLAPGSVDGMLVRGALEYQEWDRWWLQRLHSALRDGGRLALEVNHLLDLSTFAGGLDLARRAVRQTLRRVGAGRAGSFQPRRYTRARLVPMLESLRFRIDGVTADGLAPWAGLGPGPDGFASRLMIEVTKQPALPGSTPQDWPPAERARAYDQAGFSALRSKWVAAHGARFASAVSEVDPADYVGAPILVLAPHPDDEIIGAGGTLLRMAAAGARIHCVQATDGSAGAALARVPEATRVRVRVDEAIAVGKAAGFALTTCWREDNRAFRATEARIAELAGILERERPRLVFVPFVTEAHADHLTLERTLARAIEQVPGGLSGTEVWCYEVWSLVPANRRVEITSEMPRVAELLSLYEMAMCIDDFVHFCADRALDHHREWRGSNGFAEHFFAVSAARFPELLATVEAPR